MKDYLKKILTKEVIFILTVIIIGILSTFLFGNDNPIEEMSEQIVKNQTNIDVDFSPYDYENR